jgi:endonuclease YncB( thermonuclease family)
VKDGDSFEAVRTGSGREQRLGVRIFGIDAPERGQPWSRRAREALAQRVLGKTVRIAPVDVDRYGRTVGEVSADGVCIACEQLRAGHAWVYRRYTVSPALLDLEAEARAAKRGLWSLPERERVPPWEWRQRQRDKLGP